MSKFLAKCPAWLFCSQQFMVKDKLEIKAKTAAKFLLINDTKDKKVR
jgi:hypothetical protein